MTVEVLVATMFQDDDSIVERMNIQSDAVVANQTDHYKTIIEKKNGNNIKFVNTDLRGSATNRNILLCYATADVILFCDTDERLVDGYPELLKKAFREIPDADIIAFDIVKENYSFAHLNVRKMTRRAKKAPYFRHYGTVQIACRRKSITSNAMAFNELFGAGTKYAQADDALFIRLAHKNHLKIYEYPAVIANVDYTVSTHFRGFTKKYFFDKGAFCKAAFPHISVLYGGYIIKSLKKHTELKTSEMISYFLDGMKGYRKKMSYSEYYKKRGKKVLVAGGTGFLGRNLIERIEKDGRHKVVVLPRDIDEDMIDDYTRDCEFVFDFAAVHRPKNTEEFEEINHMYFKKILDSLKRNKNNCPVVYTSSIQSGDESLYGDSKRKGEEELIRHCAAVGGGRTQNI